MLPRRGHERYVVVKVSERMGGYAVGIGDAWQIRYRGFGRLT
jgi:hypothetical protein